MPGSGLSRAGMAECDGLGDTLTRVQTCPHHLDRDAIHLLDPSRTKALIHMVPQPPIKKPANGGFFDGWLGDQDSNLD